jgi:hypothetical protein
MDYTKAVEVAFAKLHTALYHHEVMMVVSWPFVILPSFGVLTSFFLHFSLVPIFSTEFFSVHPLPQQGAVGFTV